MMCVKSLDQAWLLADAWKVVLPPLIFCLFLFDIYPQVPTCWFNRGGSWGKCHSSPGTVAPSRPGPLRSWRCSPCWAALWLGCECWGAQWGVGERLDSRGSQTNPLHVPGPHPGPLSAVEPTCSLSTLMGTCPMTSVRMSPPWMSSRRAWRTRVRAGPPAVKWAGCGAVASISQISAGEQVT